MVCGHAAFNCACAYANFPAHHCMAGLHGPKDLTFKCTYSGRNLLQLALKIKPLFFALRARFNLHAKESRKIKCMHVCSLAGDVDHVHRISSPAAGEINGKYRSPAHRAVFVSRKRSINIMSFSIFRVRSFVRSCTIIKPN